MRLGGCAIVRGLRSHRIQVQRSTNRITLRRRLMKRHATIAALIILAMAALGFAQGAENKNANANAAKPKMSKKAVERALIAKEKALWEAVKKGDIKRSEERRVGKE